MHAAIAANRFGLGARPGELDVIGADPRGWLTRQVTGSRPLPEPIRSLPPSADVFAAFSDAQKQRRDRKPPSDRSQIAQRVVSAVRDKLAPLYAQQVAARYRTAIATEESFRERLVHFWTNHFAVSADKVAVLALAGTIENEAVRPHVGGRFVDMLLAVESHPAMILYLDNQASIGPGSQLGARAERRAGASGRKLDINENLAREILELHTLGVGGGYTQADVTTFALALTGWSIGGNRGLLREGEPGTFVFREGLHEPGAKTLLGKRYAQEGVGQPRAMLHDLARHPATAAHVATKLARHFIADEPPAPAIERIARAFRDSEGDLPTVHRALIDSTEAWSQPLAKFKTPHDFVVSTFRMLDFTPPQPQQFIAPFQLLGQRPYAPGSPAGWGDVAAAWDGPDALLKRIEWAAAVADRLSAGRDPNGLARQALGSVLNERTQAAISRAASAEQGMTLLLASPEFQRR